MPWEDEYLDGLTGGDWVSTGGVGYDAYPLDAFEERGIVLTNTPGIHQTQIAEHVFATALSFTRGLWRFRAQQEAHEWRQRSDLTDFAGDACCVVGLGNIGEAVARRAGAFGMTVRGVKRSVEGYDGPVDEVYPSDGLRDALDRARLVVMSLPLTDETRGTVGVDELAATTEDAILVNVGRGPTLRTDAVVAALEEGTLAAACLDVTDPEPLPPDHPLWDRDDVLITAHSAGQTDKSTDRAVPRFVEQYDRWVAGEPLRHRIV